MLSLLSPEGRNELRNDVTPTTSSQATVNAILLFIGYSKKPRCSIKLTFVYGAVGYVLARPMRTNRHSQPMRQMATPETRSSHLFNFGTPVVAKYERESAAKWAFGCCAFAHLKKCVAVQILVFTISGFKFPLHFP